jgi:serine protease Do
MSKQKRRFVHFFTGTLAGAVFSAALLLTCSHPAEKAKSPAVDEAAAQQAASPAANSSSAATPRDSYADVAAKMVPSVVNVHSTRVVKSPAGGQFFLDPFMRRFFGERLPKREQREHRARGLGSGVIISEDGYIVTNYHVVAKAADVRVALADKRKFKAEVKGKDPRTDLALIKIDADGLIPAKLGRSGDLRVGDVVLAVGNPFGAGLAVTMGIVSAVGRAGMGITDYEDFIQTDAAINPGNSGGALVNTKGELVGIPTAILSRTGGYQGIGFAIPSDLAGPILEDLKEKGKVDRGYLGVSIQELSPEIANAIGVEPGKGVLISEIQPDTAAEKAGLKQGDVIIELDGKRIQSFHRFRNRIAAKGAGSKAKLTIVRNGKRIKKEVELGELPEKNEIAERRGQKGRGDRGVFEGAKDTPMKGVKVATLDVRKRKLLNAPKNLKGVVVTGVESGSPAAYGGLRPGDILVRVNRKPTPTIAKFREAVKAGGERVFALVWRQGRMLYLAWRMS